MIGLEIQPKPLNGKTAYNSFQFFNYLYAYREVIG